eukprot:CAMPEP_0178424068 /NCGR_PEP_ID=MMETSP0689_2-20121128/28019_1 /TAXON_ID=160604 /ORGANISM="Amphidinium massartii, Strain CS-259" /LENGTH=211 /DNA_ID=CAMNT_0020045693 /DNA_START=29 /DNA_END=664 /DNA_ORIENTATION=+
MSKLWRPLPRLGARYMEASKRRPHLTASLSASILLSLGDAGVQWLEGAHQLDTRRTLGMFAFGFLYVGGVQKKVYLLYDRFLPGRYVVQTVVDCFLHFPFGILPSFYAITGTAKGQSIEQWSRQLQADWRTNVTSALAIWLPASMIGFGVVPQATRIPFVASVSFFHKAWMSHFSNRHRRWHAEASGCLVTLNPTAPSEDGFAGVQPAQIL